jgi:predicted Ser/Thr protein kinase
MKEVETTRSVAGLDRETLARSTERVLNRGRWGNPDVLLVGLPEGSVVVKDFAPRRAWLRRTFGRWLMAREARAYRRLVDVAAVPRLLGRLDADAIVIEYRPGVLLSRSLAGTLPREFLPELETAIDSMHRRGVVHLDLRHRSNILAGDDGHPIVLDFASAIRFDPTRRRGRLGIRLLGWIDRRALEKWRVRLGQPSPSSGAVA